MDEDKSSTDLSRLLKDLHGLSKKDFDTFVDELFESCGPEQRWRLQEKLPALLFRDFFTDLPPELLDKVLRYLDGPNLLNCLKVSKSWNDRLTANENLWRNEAKRIGWDKSDSLGEDRFAYNFYTDDEEASEPNSNTDGRQKSSGSRWKNACIKSLKFRRQLKNGTFFASRTTRDIVSDNVDIAAIDYDKGYVAVATSKCTGLENNSAIETVVIWSLSDNKILCKVSVPPQVAVIKLGFPDILICGHLDGFVTTVYFEYVSKGNADCQSITSQIHNFDTLNCRRKSFRGHTSAVISLEVNKEIGLLATGSADGSIAFWKWYMDEHTSDHRVKSLTEFSHWVVKIILRSASQHSIISLNGCNLLFSMTRDNITLHSWKIDSPTNKDEYDHIQDYSNLKQVTIPNYVIPLRANPIGLRDVFFTPGLHLIGDKVAFIKQMPMFETPTIGDADIVLADAGTGQILNTVHVNQKVRKLLAVGKRFAVILLPYVDSRYKNLAIVDLKERQIIGGFTVPHSRPSTPDFSQVTTGDLQWLDGITEDNVKNKFVTGLVIDHSALHTVYLSN